MPETDGKSLLRTDASSPLLDCDRRFSNIELILGKHDTTLYGKYGNDGVIGDIAQIKYQTGAVRFLAQAGFGVLVTIVTLFLSRWFGL